MEDVGHDSWFAAGTNASKGKMPTDADMASENERGYDQPSDIQYQAIHWPSNKKTFTSKFIHNSW